MVCKESSVCQVKKCEKKTMSASFETKLTPKEFYAMKRLANKWAFNKAIHPYDDANRFIDCLSLESRKIPLRILHTIQQFKKKSSRTGVLLLSGLPTDPILPPTPVVPNAKIMKPTFISEMWLSIIGSALGDIYGYTQEKSGNLFHSVYPTKAGESTQSNEGSKIELAFHSEDIHHPYPPDYVLLFCLRQDLRKEAKTFYADISDIYPRLTDAEARTLQTKEFYTGPPYSFGFEAGTTFKEPMSILYGHSANPFIRYNFLTQAKSSSARSALESLRIVANQVRKQIYLKAGDLLILNNRRVLHSRSEFYCDFQGNDRWLQRAFVMRDLLRATEDINQNERIVRTNLDALIHQ
jgi:L-asparagine oxygenase